MAVHPVFAAALHDICNPAGPDLSALRKQAWRDVDLAQAHVHDLDALISDRDGDPWSAEWHRLEAVKLRNRTPENEERSHRAWLVAMARLHLRNGTTPDGHEADAIVLTMDELREASHGPA